MSLDQPLTCPGHSHAVVHTLHVHVGSEQSSTTVTILVRLHAYRNQRPQQWDHEHKVLHSRGAPSRSPSNKVVL